MNFTQPDFSFRESSLSPIESFIFNECMIDEPFNASLIGNFSKSHPFDIAGLVYSQETFITHEEKLFENFYRHLTSFLEKYVGITSLYFTDQVFGNTIEIRRAPKNTSISKDFRPTSVIYCCLEPILTNDLKFGISLNHSQINFDAFGQIIKKGNVFTDFYQFENTFAHYCTFFNKTVTIFNELDSFYYSKNVPSCFDDSISSVINKQFMELSKDYFDVRLSLNYKFKNNVYVYIFANMVNGTFKVSIDDNESIIYNSLEEISKDITLPSKINKAIEMKNGSDDLF
jgi:hypothetical protein